MRAAGAAAPSAPRRLILPNSRRKLSLLPAAEDGGRRILARSDSAAAMGERQSGHERLDWSQVSMHSAWKAWQQRGRRRRRSWWWNLERQTAQSAAAVAERRVTEENVNSGSVSMTEVAAADEECAISGEMRRLEENIGVAEADAEGAAEEEEKRRRQRRLRWRRRKHSARETITVTARTVTIMRMLGLRLLNGDERRGDGGVRELEATVGNVLSVPDPTTFSVNGGAEAIAFVPFSVKSD